jgi:hypothetical protein
LHYDEGAYWFDGLYDAHWKDAATGWSNVETEIVLSVLCKRINDRGNGSAHKYSFCRDE